MATPDHKARAHPSFTQDDHLTPFPDTSHRANLTAQPHIDAPRASLTRLGGSTLACRQRGVTLPIATWATGRDERPVRKPGLLA